MAHQPGGRRCRRVRPRTDPAPDHRRRRSEPPKVTDLVVGTDLDVFTSPDLTEQDPVEQLVTQLHEHRVEPCTRAGTSSRSRVRAKQRRQVIEAAHQDTAITGA